MNRKLLSIPLIALMFCMLAPIAFVGGADAPNKDQIYWASIGMPETVDPHWAYDTASGGLIQNVYEPLCIFNVTDPESFLSALSDDWPGYGTGKNKVVPSAPKLGGAAETWEFHIRLNVPWQDEAYGDVTPEDVEYSAERGMLFDHTFGPMWMLYEPLLMGASSYDYDHDGDGTLNKTEYDELAVAIDTHIESNETCAWFNLDQPYAPFQQILSQTWSVVMSRDWCIDHGLWNKTIVETYGWTSDEAYDEFIRTWDLPEPGPLMEQDDAPGPTIPGPVMMGTGPYTLAAMNSDPHTGFWTLEKNDAYWRLWPASAEFYTDGVAASGYAQYATYKNVEEWANRKAQFLSSAPALQVDLCAVPRENCPELHEGGDKDADPLPGFRLMFITTPALDALYFTFTVNPDTAYKPKIGTEIKYDIMQDRNLRLGFANCFNFTAFLHDIYLDEAIQPPVCMPPGTAYYNASKPLYGINFTKATEYFQQAWGGRIWTEGMTVPFAYNTGNVARQTIAEIFEYGVENFIEWPAGVVVDIVPQGVPWATYLTDVKKRMYTTFTVGWLADFPDPHNWFQPFMHPAGTYCGRQNVTYGLDSTSLNANWYAGATYPHPPYTNALGETVPVLNNTYIRHMIDVGVGQADEIRHMIYEELMDIYYAECTQLPLNVAVGRHYERTWIHGYDKSFNMNPIAPGPLFYTMWKALDVGAQSVDVAAYTVEMSPESNITSYLLAQAYHTSGNPVVKPVPYMKMNTTGTATVPIVLANAKIKYYNVSGPDVLVYITWTGITPKGHAEEFYYAVSLISPGGSLTLGPGDVSEEFPLIGDYNLWTLCYVLSEFAFNVNVTQNFFASWFNATGLCDINGDLVVDIADYQLVKKAIPSTPGSAKWRWMADVATSNVVDISDYQLVKGTIPDTYSKS